MKTEICYLLMLISIVKGSNVGCNVLHSKIPDTSNSSRYQECEGKWVAKDCEYDHVFDFQKKTCVPKVDPNAYNKPQAAVDLSNNQQPHIDTPHSGSGDTTNCNCGGGRGKPIHKYFRSVTQARGDDVKTTVWYYNSEGPNYKITISGYLPVSRDRMIDWLEKNSKLYKITPVPYYGDADENVPLSAPSAPSSVPTPARYPAATKPPPLFATATSTQSTLLSAFLKSRE